MTPQFAISHLRDRATEQALPQISRDTLNDVAALIETLLAENERLKADKERLDWVENQPNIGLGRDRDLRIVAVWTTELGRAKTVREAIDAARSAEKGQTP